MGVGGIVLFVGAEEFLLWGGIFFWGGGSGESLVEKNLLIKFS